MQCQKCSSKAVRTSSTNSSEANRTVRKRMCLDCGHVWFTVEVPVHKAVVGWGHVSDGGQSKPILRVPLEVALQMDAT